MVTSRFQTPIDFRSIGKHMSRERYQRGSLKKVGKTRQRWRGRWHVYIPDPDGSEKLCKRERILGPVSQLSKGQAQDKLDVLIKASLGQFTARQCPILHLQTYGSGMSNSSRRRGARPRGRLSVPSSLASPPISSTGTCSPSSVGAESVS